MGRLTLGQKNLITGLGLGAFVTGVFLYSLRSIKQDDFSDVDKQLAKEREENKPLTSRPSQNRMG